LESKTNAPRDAQTVRKHSMRIRQQASPIPWRFSRLAEPRLAYTLNRSSPEADPRATAIDEATGPTVVPVRCPNLSPHPPTTPRRANRHCREAAARRSAPSLPAVPPAAPPFSPTYLPPSCRAPACCTRYLCPAASCEAAPSLYGSSTVSRSPARKQITCMIYDHKAAPVGRKSEQRLGRCGRPPPLEYPRNIRIIARCCRATIHQIVHLSPR